MNIAKFLNDILGAINGQRAWDWVAKISQYSRVQASNGYHDSLEVIKEELLSLGFDDIEHFKSPADGETTIWGYPASYQWEIKAGKLWIEEPEKTKLCDFNDIPVSIVTHSKSCDISAEIVDIGTGDNKEDYENNDVEGKIILMSGPIYLNRPLIEKSKAIGVIYYPDLNRTKNNLDRVIYNGFFTTKERMNNAKFGFSISYNQAMHLKELLKKGLVKVHASINAEFMEGHFEVLSSCIKGTEFPEQEIVIISHLCHPLPSANDNASGAAGLLELARAFKYLIKNEIIDSPKRTLRFVWVPEFNGTVPWMKFHEDRIKNVLACINLDMIGEHPLKLGQPFEVNLAPRSTPSILNDIASTFIKKIADHPKGIAINGTKNPMSYRLRSYDGGSDHFLFVDSYFGIPSLMLSHNDPNWHSNVDTVEYCDSTELKRVIAIALSISYVFSTIDKVLISKFWPIVRQGLFKRIGTLVKLLEELSLSILSSENAEKTEFRIDLFLLGRYLIKACFQYEIELLERIKLIESSSETLQLIELAKKEIEELENSQNTRWNEINDFDEEELKKEEQIFKTIYELTYPGPLYARDLFKLVKYHEFENFLAELKYEFLGPINELFNLLGKGYNTLTITAFLSLEYETLVQPKKIQTLINHLEKEELIKKK
ncbi:MAG: DUF4910 domain-containing protein [Candidatus Lokiarchaeota archaeon]|nr:DUF4910 domain-containing protein [Candidatus Lokiarchaeota archaeon]